MREAVKTALRAAATLVVMPMLLSYALRRAFIGDRAFEGSMQVLALLPGLVGDYLRRAFLARTIARMDPSATVRFGTLMSDPRARLDANVYVGPGCHLGFVHIERDALIAAGAHIPSGAATHGTAETDVPFRDQPLTRTCVHIGEGAWIGSAAIVMADVGTHSIVGAGSVVTRTVPDYSVVAGVPAKIIKTRVGPIGPAGPLGPLGPIGPLGPLGPPDSGPTGPLGSMGPLQRPGSGPSEPTGPTDPMGLSEPKGPIGPIGPAGPTEDPRG